MHLVAMALQGSGQLRHVHGHAANRDRVKALPGEEGDTHSRFSHAPPVQVNLWEHHAVKVRVPDRVPLDLAPQVES
jgi:hypothetical protein